MTVKSCHHILTTFYITTVIMEVEQQPNPHPLQDRNMDAFYELADAIAASRGQKHGWQHSSSDGRSPASSDSQQSSRTPIRKRSLHRPTSLSSQLNLAQLAKIRVMAVHVENWRDDSQCAQQHIGLQHVIGSLRRDEDDSVDQGMPHSERDYIVDIPATPAWSEDSFLHLLRSPKSDQHSTSTKASGLTPETPNEQYQESEQAPEPSKASIATAALPGLNMALNIATLTASERAMFAELAPKDLEDPHVLNAEVLRSRMQMMSGASKATEMERLQPAGAEEQPIVAADLDEFVDFSGWVHSNL